MIFFAVFLFGAVIGSFLNVCIYRVPRGQSIVRPSSQCTSCGRPVRFYDNIPVISYLLLRGKCRSCGTALSLRYPLVELLNALLYLIVLKRFYDASPLAVMAYFAFASALLVIFFIDVDFQIIPDSITLPGIPLALALASTVLPDPFARYGLLGFQASLLGVLAGGGFFYLAAILGKAVFKKDAMGGGDIKMMAMVGGVMGWKAVLLTTFAASLLGSLIGVSMILLKGREWGARIPFGPYLAIGALISMLWGQDIMIWYFLH